MTTPALACEKISSLAPGFRPKVGLILGTGLNDLADTIKNPIVIPYGDIPGFHQSGVEGHKGQLVLGQLNDVPVACFQGRVHLYEGASFDKVKLMIYTFKQLGCETLLLTNAAGSLRENVGPGDIMMITDHINFQNGNPMVGPNDDSFGERFFAMHDAYHPELQAIFREQAKALTIQLHEGVYIGVLGPSFETPAEIRAFKRWGADAVGMSTVPEVIVARHCGLKVAAFSAITNLAAGLVPDQALNHDESLHFGQQAGIHLSTLIETTITHL